MKMRHLLFGIISLCFGCSITPNKVHDMVIINASVLNTITGNTEFHKTIVIDTGYITAVLDSDVSVSALTILDAKQSLVTPGFIDAVGHLDDVFGDRPDTLNMKMGSVPGIVKLFAENYLPYGVTTVRNSGDGSGYYILADYLSQAHNPSVPDFYYSGGSLAGWYDGSPYINHLLVQDSSEAEFWVNSLHALGSIQSVKIYCNSAMNYPIFAAALRKAQSLDMIVTSQVQGEITIDSALTLGLVNFEHASTLCYQRNLFNFNDDPAFNDTIQKYWDYQDEGIRIYRFLEAANFCGKNNPQINATIMKMKSHNATMTTSLHFFAQWLNKTWFCSEPKGIRFATNDFTPLQQERCVSGYMILASYVKKMYDAGIPLVMGTDHKDGGKAVLSELMLLHELGIPMSHALQIATINTARATGLADKYGSIEPGKRANLIVFEKNPLDDAKNVLSKKTIIKDGIVYVSQK